MNILCYRSPYLQRNLASNKRNNDNFLVHIKLPNISPEIFQIILEYIYGGILSLDGQDTLDFLKILVAADELCLQELVNYLQKYLIENKSEDDLQMNEVEVWENILKWGLAQNSTLIPDPITWTDDDFKKMKVTLQNCIPLVRFFCLSSKEFTYKVRPYQKLLSNQFYEELLNSYLDPDSVSIYNVLRPRKIVTRSPPLKNTAQIIDSQIVDSGTEEIIGGYNPLKWESPNRGTWSKTKESFIFSFKDKNIKDAIISNVKYEEYAILYNSTVGPYFGSDIIIGAYSESVDYTNSWCRKCYYEKEIRETPDKFSMEDYEYSLYDDKDFIIFIIILTDLE
ncbi:hypothetical protein GLOIN_2v1763573 [Rhizophagus irregularis DAOM 181602=DAOM 197198]|nr:hypothetical protein GLOIN_2v1763573 [Rhizophagus irregularis DAOM 181602=DAOM 197198]